MGGLAGDERVLPGREVEPLDDAQVGEDVERSEDGGPGDAKSTPPRFAEELVGREVAAARRDQAGQRSPRRGQPLARLLERTDDRAALDHGPILDGIETESQ